MTAAATTGPNRHPRPTSSTPATNRAPAPQASFSYFVVHFSRLSRRSLAADGEISSSGLSRRGMRERQRKFRLKRAPRQADPMGFRRAEGRGGAEKGQD